MRPKTVVSSYFTGVINRFVLEVEESASELIEAVTLRMALGQPQVEKYAPAKAIPREV